VRLENCRCSLGNQTEKEVVIQDEEKQESSELRKELVGLTDDPCLGDMEEVVVQASDVALPLFGYEHSRDHTIVQKWLC
jgi:hypothetical protein